ncbi:MAG: 3'-5' exonuclease [Gammaproteobacteria bacterium]
MNILIFDIETIPDLDAGRRLFDLDGLADEDIARAMMHLRQQKTGSEFLPHHLQRVVAISIVLQTRDSVKVWSLGDETSSEAELLRRFYDGLDRFEPTLVSWNGSGFDLPVIHYRSLLHGVSAPRYWDVGDDNQQFRYNNYLGRFHWRHTDLMDVLAAYNPRAFAPLDQIAGILGLPGKMGMGGDKVWEAYLAGKLDAIRDYCETDVLNTYLVYLRFELIRGSLGEEGYRAACDRLDQSLTALDKPHLREFQARWKRDAEVAE